MEAEDLEKIKKDIKNYKPEIIILLYLIVLEEIKRRMEKKFGNNKIKEKKVSV